MIRLMVEEYCSECLEFDADVELPSKMFGDDGRTILLTDTVVTCTNKKRCEMIKRYLERKLGENG